MNVSIVVSEAGVDPSVVPVGPAVVNVQKSNLSVQTSTNDIKMINVFYIILHTTFLISHFSHVRLLDLA